MKVSANRHVVVAGIAALLVALPAHASINKSVEVPDGGTSSGASTVNGRITIGADATVTGGVETVNGKIRIGKGAKVEDAATVNGGIRVDDDASSEDLSTVNGGIRIGNNVVVDGEVSAVNGGISAGKGTTVARDLTNVNGGISLEGSTVGGSVETVNGGVELSDSAVIRGDLVVIKPNRSNWSDRKQSEPLIVIGPGSRVEGVIRLERKARLYISDSATVGGVEGVMSLSDAVRFSGDRPDTDD